MGGGLKYNVIKMDEWSIYDFKHMIQTTLFPHLFQLSVKWVVDYQCGLDGPKDQIPCCIAD